MVSLPGDDSTAQLRELVRSGRFREALEVFRESIPRGAKLESQWNQMMERYGSAHPEKFREWEVLQNGFVYFNSTF